VFCVTENLKYATHLRGDRRVNAVVSLWEAIDKPRRLKSERLYPIQAWCRRLVRLKQPVPKQMLIDAGILTVPRWPQGVQGKSLDLQQTIKLAEVLATKNPAQRRAIHHALGLRGMDEATKRLIELGGTQPQLRGIPRRRMA
jgi:hypothetical protein